MRSTRAAEAVAELLSLAVMVRYWFQVCPNCDGQGRLFICREKESGDLYLHCEECEWGFRDPRRCADASDGFLAIDGESDIATLSEIETAGWSCYAKHMDS